MRWDPRVAEFVRLFMLRFEGMDRYDYTSRKRAAPRIVSCSDAELLAMVERLDQAMGLDAYADELDRLAGIIRDAQDSDYVTSAHPSHYVQNLPAVKDAATLPKAELARLLMATAQAAAWAAQLGDRAPSYGPGLMARAVVLHLLAEQGQRKLPYTMDQVRALIRIAVSASVYPLQRMVLPVIERNRDELKRDSSVHGALRSLRARLAEWNYDPKSRQHVRMIDQITGAGATSPLRPGQTWARLAEDELGRMTADARAAWCEFLQLARTCNESKPSKEWRAEIGTALETVGIDAVVHRLAAWLSIAAGEDLPHPRGAHDDWEARHANENVLCGLAWAAGLAKRPALLRALADAVESCTRGSAEEKFARARLAGACLRALGSADTPEALAQLSRLALRVRWPKMKKVVKKQFEDAVKRSGLSRDDVEETLVPDFGLRDGVARLPFGGDVVADVTIERADKPSVMWRAPGKAPSRVPPKSLKASDPEAAATVKQLASDIERMRAAQRTRLDLLFRRTKSWRFDAWAERYLHHGLVSSLARRLIWEIDRTPVIWRDGAMRDIDGAAIEFARTADVTLWHPADHALAEIVGWRTRLQEWEITQPFKQAYREIYLLTDAERRTRIYSNRFAAHVLRTGTLLAISQVRGWKAGLFGGASSPSTLLPDFDLLAEWWVDAAGDESNHFGGPTYLSSDQVRFYSTAQPQDQPLELERIPLRAFTEVMRDVDLFVGIASVGNDPNWQDSGANARFRDYWHSYSFGDLTETAKTRREVLGRLIPRLKIASRCSLSDKFLVVRGTRRTYKIHLGSGNILMEPNDQYLCIVPARGAAAGQVGGSDRLFLPFEGDATLSIILSKAFLLAQDSTISDETILRQIT